MVKKLFFACALLMGLSATSFAKDYNASIFGIKSDGITLNTGSIQRAIDFISEEGGGRLMFYVGRYLTGTITLKSNVTIHLEEGAVLVGAKNIYDYFSGGKFLALVNASDQTNISITGKGVIMGNGAAIMNSIRLQKEAGNLPATFGKVAPGIVQFNGCKNIDIFGVIIEHSASDVIALKGCTGVKINGISVMNKGVSAYGLRAKGVDKMDIANSYFITAGSPLFNEGENSSVKVTSVVDDAGKSLRF